MGKFVLAGYVTVTANAHLSAMSHDTTTVKGSNCKGHRVFIAYCYFHLRIIVASQQNKSTVRVTIARIMLVFC